MIWTWLDELDVTKAGGDDELANSAPASDSYDKNPSVQKDFNMRAAFSHSLSTLPGQYVSFPYLETPDCAVVSGVGDTMDLIEVVPERRDGAILSAQPKTLPKAPGLLLTWLLFLGDGGGAPMLLLLLASTDLVRSQDGNNDDTLCMMVIYSSGRALRAAALDCVHGMRQKYVGCSIVFFSFASERGRDG